MGRRLALAQHKRGSPVEAMATLRSGIRRKPDDAELHYQLGVMLAAENDFDGAEGQFEMAMTLEPSHAGAHERLAQCCSLSGRPERALHHLQKAHHLDPSDARIAMQLNLLAQSITIGGTRPTVDWSPGKRAHEAPGLDDQLLDQLGKSILKEPDFVETFLSLPVSDVDEEVFSGLAATLELALGKHPEYADLHYHCGAVYRRLGKSQDAIAHAERAVEINPRFVKALILLAELYNQTNRYRDGVERLEQAVRAGGDYSDVHYMIGRLCENNRCLDDARKAYQRALDLNGDYQAAREALDSLPA